MQVVRPTRTARPPARSGPVVAYMPARGIGDVVWHVPTLRRLAALTPERAVTFLTRPTTHAAELLKYDPAIAEVAYVPFQGKRHKFREVATLTQAFRTLAPRAAWVLDQTAQPSFAAWLAGVPERRGTGEGRPLQICMLSPGPRLPRSDRHKLEKLARFMDLWDAPPSPPGPLLIVGGAERAAMRVRFAALPRPWIAFGVTASWPPKVWGADRFVAAADQIAKGGTAFFIGGPNDAAVTQDAARAASSCVGVSVCDLAIGQLMGLLEQVDVFVGNDSGPLNVAAGVGAPSLGLFGPTPVLDYAPNLHGLVSPDETMGSISVGAVVSRAAPLLARPAKR
jgi:heptosyltransferase-2